MADVKAKEGGKSEKDAAGQSMRDVLAARHLDREADVSERTCSHPGVLKAREEVRKKAQKQELPKMLSEKAAKQGDPRVVDAAGMVAIELGGEILRLQKENNKLAAENRKLTTENTQLKTANSRLKRQVPTDSGFHP